MWICTHLCVSTHLCLHTCAHMYTHMHTQLRGSIWALVPCSHLPECPDGPGTVLLPLFPGPRTSVGKPSSPGTTGVPSPRVA